MWNNKFHSLWYIWNDDPTEQIGHINNFYFLSLDRNLSWTIGIELALNALVKLKEPCEYFFVHDDDLTFSIKKQFHKPETLLSDVLITTLQTFRPAIASFPWKVADERIRAMNELVSVYENETIAPLTGFDSGMVIYHKSIVSFFIPFSPRGEGGFNGEWTLCAHFLQMFANLLFGKYAIRLNMFEYYHSVNIDNISSNKNDKRHIRYSGGLAYVSNSRHPYEFPQNKAYKVFLSSGLKNPYQLWGHMLTKEHGFETLRATDTQRNSFDGLWLLNRLNEVYDIRHSALSKNDLLKHQFTDEQKLKVLRQTKFTVKLIILTLNPSKSFKRLWKSIINAISIDRIVNIVVYLDMDESDKERQEYFEYLSNLRSLHGDVQLVVYYANRGLKTIMKEAWNPLNNDEYAIFLEDDTEVSSYFLLYIDKLIKTYFYALKLDERLFGISLYNLRFNEVIDEYVSVSNDHQLYLYQIPQSWGALYAPIVWRKFLNYLRKDFDPFIPNSCTNRWPFEKSWKKYLLRFMYQGGGCLIYPNFRNGFSLSTNHLEIGLNDKLRNLKDKTTMQLKFSVPLLNDRKIFEELETPSFDRLQIFNVYHKRVSSLDDLNTAAADLTSFDTCTMVLTVYDRTNTTLARLAYYQDFTYLSAIIVIWNNINVEPLTKEQLKPLKIPVHILKMTRNSLNNRFYPHKEIQTDCVINMDDDWDMPYAHMAFAIDTWRGHFFNNLVGFTHQGRNHLPYYNNGTIQYTYNRTVFSSNKGAFYSIVLPPGFVYHRRYLYQYTYELPQIARDIVDSLRNCDDILFNFLIANATKQGPVLIAAYANPYNVSGLWKRPNHMKTRTLCLLKFTEIFHEMPLRYTTSMFPIDRTKTVPGRNKYHFQHQIPVKYS